MNISQAIFYLLLSLAHESRAASWSVLSVAVENVTTIYLGNTSLIPVQDLSKTFNVSLGLQLLTVNDFDDVAGIMDISTYLSMEWTEEIYVNVYGSTAPDTSVTVSAASIWKPSLILVNSAGEGTEIVQQQSQVRIYLKSGKCEWTENVVFKASCRPNVYFYPFDVHDCSVKFTTRAYTSNELTLISSGFEKDYFEENVAWSVRKTSAETISQDKKSHIKFLITIARRPLNYILNYIFPILILSVLNIFVFLLPRTSGERAGYSVTCFLAFVVFMNIIVTSLPKSSAPVSVLVYYVTVMMVISAVITIIVLFTLIINGKADKEDKEAKQIKNNKTVRGQSDGQFVNSGDSRDFTKHRYHRFCCRCCATDRVEDMSAKNQLSKARLHPPRNLQNIAWFLRRLACLPPEDRKNLRWVQVGNTLDIFLFLFFLIGEFIFSAAYLAPISQQYSAEDLRLH